MGDSNFSDVIDFAIGRERAAVAFYEELSRIASFAAQKSTLAEFRTMEEGHVAMLLGMKARGAVKLSARVAVDLGLAERLGADEEPSAGMSYQDILTAAIKKEARAADLYASLEASASDPDIKSVFGRLKAEETRHGHYFENLYETEVARDN